MEHLPIFKSEIAPTGDKLKGKDVTVGVSAGRKKLAEITNLQSVPKLSSQFDTMQTVSLSAKDFIHQLQNVDENMGLKKAIMDRNKLIELSRIETQKLTVSFEKVQLQNVQLAQANSQLLQELNSGKDKLKALQHELGCKNGLLKALKSKTLPAASQAHPDEAETNKTAKEGVPVQLINKNEHEVQEKFNPSEHKQQSRRESLRVSTKVGVRSKAENLEAPGVGSSLPRRQSMRLRSEVSQTKDDVLATDEPQLPICPVTADQACESTSGAQDMPVRKVGVKKKAVNQDACSRRQSRRFRLDFTQTSEDPCDIGIVQTPACIATAETERDGDSEVSKSAIKEENIEGGLTAVTTQSQVSHRHCTGKPLRHAALRIQSYKEVPINVKMRRDD